MKLAIVLGTRPEIMKNYAIVMALRRNRVPFVVLHTNQHVDAEMAHRVFEQMGYAPDAVFPESYRIGAAIDWVREQIRVHGVDRVLVNGDTAAALVGAVAALYSDVPLVHVEAGLRAFDGRMIEERNRIMVDAAAQVLFTYADYQAEYLRHMPEVRGRIETVGNTTVDLIHDFSDQLDAQRPGRYAYVTLHRKEFTDCRRTMVQVFGALNELAPAFDAMVFPMHPRTRGAMQGHRLGMGLLNRLDVVAPIEPIRSLAHIKHAQVVITDSGCIQEEALLFSSPCVTVRNNTERPETLVRDANIVSGFDIETIQRTVMSQRSRKGESFDAVYGGYGAGERIVASLLRDAAHGHAA
jgi:UDP-N-acetylglucosamine 2-epimerase